MYLIYKKDYWWEGLKRDKAKFVTKFPYCQQTKAEHRRSGGLTQEMAIPTWKWEDAKMDFIVGLPRTHNQIDSIWVIVDRLTKSVHFIPIKATDSVEGYAKFYLKEIVTIYGLTLSIILGRGTQFTSHLWKAFQSGLGTKVKLCNVFHSQTDGFAE